MSQFLMNNTIVLKQRAHTTLGPRIRRRTRPRPRPPDPGTTPPRDRPALRQPSATQITAPLATVRLENWVVSDGLHKLPLSNDLS